MLLVESKQIQATAVVINPACFTFLGFELRFIRLQGEQLNKILGFARRNFKITSISNSNKKRKEKKEEKRKKKKKIIKKDSKRVHE